MPNASMASRPSMIASIGEPQVHPSIDRLTTCSAPGLEAGFLEQRLQQHALPQGVADQVATDRVGHARQCDVSFDLVASQQIVKGQFDRVVDEPRDVQSPRIGGDLRHDECGVDPVEVVVRHDERLDAVDAEFLAPSIGAARSMSTSLGSATVSVATSSDSSADRLAGQREIECRPRTVAAAPTDASDDRRLPSRRQRRPSRTGDDPDRPSSRRPNRRRSDRGASHQMIATDTAVPTRSAPASPASFRDAATPPMHPSGRPRWSDRMRSSVRPRIAKMPIIEPTPSTTTSAPETSTTLSFVPNCSIAQSLNHFGVMSMNSWPTGTTGDDDPRRARRPIRRQRVRPQWRADRGRGRATDGAAVLWTRTHRGGGSAVIGRVGASGSSADSSHLHLGPRVVESALHGHRCTRFRRRSHARSVVDDLGVSGNVRLPEQLVSEAIGSTPIDPDTLDLKIATAALTEMREAYRVFAPFKDEQKVSIFGSARTQPDDPLYAQARDLAGALAERGWMTVTGAGPGIMHAGHGRRWARTFDRRLDPAARSSRERTRSSPATTSTSR